MIQNLQALRALAAWMVVAHHLRGPLQEIWPALGDTLIFAAGVDVFFVLSGYVMVASTRGRRVAPTLFWRRRFVRIAPLYWLVTTAIVAALIVGLSPIGVGSWTWRDIAASYLFLGVERSDGYPGPLLGVGWTLAYEAFFYALFGFALLARERAVPMVLAALVAIVVLGAVATPTSFAGQFYTAPILLEFASGVGLAYLRLDKGGKVMVGLGALGLMLGASALSAVASDGDLITPGGAGAIWRTLFFGVPAALIVAGAIAMEREGAVCHNAFVLDQGDASYALYLLHLPLLQVLDKTIGLDAALLVVAPPLLAMTAHMTHRYWERPAMAILRPRLFDLRAYRLAG